MSGQKQEDFIKQEAGNGRPFKLSLYQYITHQNVHLTNQASTLSLMESFILRRIHENGREHACGSRSIALNNGIGKWQ